MSASSRERWGAAFVFAAGVGLVALHSSRVASTARRGLQSRAGRRALAAEENAAIAEQAASEARPYVRRLVIEEPPLPGQPREAASATPVPAGSAAARRSFAAGSPGYSMPEPDFDGGGYRSSASARAAASTPGAAQGGGPASGPPAAPPGNGTAAAPASDSSGIPVKAAASVLAATRALQGQSRASGDEGPPTEKAVAAGLMQGIADDRRVDGEVRDALAELGPGASLDARKRAVADVLESEGRGDEPEDVLAALSAAQAPRRPTPPAKALAAAVNDIASHPTDAATRQDILQHVDDVPPLPTGPPPKGAADAYQKYRDVFTQAKTDYGVDPQYILGILSVETSYGANMGNKKLVDVLKTLATVPRKSAQAQSDLNALATLSADGDLGPMKPSDVPSNYAGAYGPPQFLASSQLAYGRSADGHGTDLFQFPNAILSIANYLKMHGYSDSVSKSIYGYNHSQAYVNLVLQRSANIAPLIKDTPPAKTTN